MGLTPRAERAAVRGALRGDAAALDALFAGPLAGRLPRPRTMIIRDAHAAEDIAQEGFVAAVRALERFDRSRPFGPWLRTIVARRAIDACAGAVPAAARWRTPPRTTSPPIRRPPRRT